MLQEMGRPSPDQVYRYFSRLGLELRQSFKMHKAFGLWERTPEHKRDWGNVSEHCLVEAARADVFSELLGFSPELKNDLRTAAAVSDYFKRREKEIAEGHGNSDEAFDWAEQISSRWLAQSGFNDRVIYLAEATGTVKSIEIHAPRLLAKKYLENDEMAYLVLHYIDDYSIGSSWVEPAEALENGSFVNAFDKRMDDLDVRYPELKELGFNDKQRTVGYQVEQRLAEAISRRVGAPIEPKKIPEMVDQMIAQRIQATS